MALVAHLPEGVKRLSLPQGFSGLRASGRGSKLNLVLVLIGWDQTEARHVKDFNQPMQLCVIGTVVILIGVFLEEKRVGASAMRNGKELSRSDHSFSGYLSLAS
ncbi:hypothetical protein RRG08_003945 [Elysia crispata]|uniref:Uncharacterized protein n=1 Tax=Elysia crispata TaxID=231223 RepID=A0AAE0YBR6_9GAST|nr:hypothetical protein RRG08_003945 [Elysia crispata]